ncbi:DUF4913 domain-containing protein, partial [Gordonia sp. NPDC062954]|uniref:DUF4913 domain-containing protein n=1 Tax=Gordonia sp. NPDC062954 TaxID=3364003 RepID=UPI0037C77B34
MTTPDTDTPDDDPRAHWRFTSGADWFTNWLSHIKAGRFDRDTRWCAQWWRHDEVVIRLEELWKAWETGELTPDLGHVESRICAGGSEMIKTWPESTIRR